MNDVIKKFEELTVRDIVLYFWIEEQDRDVPRFIRGRRRTIDESIMLCGGDVKRYLNYANDYERTKLDR